MILKRLLMQCLEYYGNFCIALIHLQGQKSEYLPKKINTFAATKKHICIGHRMQIWLQTYFVHLFLVHLTNKFFVVLFIYG